MSDATYTPLVYTKQGGAEMVVASGASINVEPGGSITANGTQASHIANATGGLAATNQARINSILLVLEGAGLTATS